MLVELMLVPVSCAKAGGEVASEGIRKVDVAGLLSPLGYDSG